MKLEKEPANLTTTSGTGTASPAKKTEHRSGWSVNFVLPQPKSMPSERLKARAELVRSALSSTSY